MYLNNNQPVKISHEAAARFAVGSFNEGRACDDFLRLVRSSDVGAIDVFLRACTQLIQFAHCAGGSISFDKNLDYWGVMSKFEKETVDARISMEVVLAGNTGDFQRLVNGGYMLVRIGQIVTNKIRESGANGLDIISLTKSKRSLYGSNQKSSSADGKNRSRFKTGKPISPGL